ncbi:MAG: hypothetical protein ACI4WS_02515 [Oscillospiraceae bacterium]
MRENSSVNGFKYSRVLRIYTKLMKGEIINKAAEAQRFGVNQRSLQRDIDDLRAFFEDQNAEGAPRREILYSREQGGYFLKMSDEESFTDSEILVVCQTVLSSPQIAPGDRGAIVEKLLQSCVPGRKREQIRRMLFREEEPVTL